MPSGSLWERVVTRCFPNYHTNVKTQTHFNAYSVLVTGIAAMGGLLFGYDTGVVAAAQLFLEDDFVLSTVQLSLFVAVTLLGALVAAAASGSLVDRFGRKPLVLAGSVLFTIGGMAIAFATAVWVLMLGRLIVGAGVGVASQSVPVFIAETTHASLRGSMVSVMICACTLHCMFLCAYPTSVM
jgi:MFS family permease